MVLNIVIGGLGWMLLAITWFAFGVFHLESKPLRLFMKSMGYLIFMIPAIPVTLIAGVFGKLADFFYEIAGTIDDL